MNIQSWFPFGWTGSISLQSKGLSSIFSPTVKKHQFFCLQPSLGFPGGTSGKESTCQCRKHKRCGWIPGSERSLGVGNGNPLQYSCLEHSMDRGAWQATVHWVAKSQTQVSIHTQPSLWSNSHIHTWLVEKNIALTIWTFVSKAMSLLFNMLSRFVIAFLPRSKRLLISWLQSLSTVILETKKIKSVTVSIFPHLFAMNWWDQMPWSSFWNVEF